MMDYIINLYLSIASSIISHYIIKWLDKLEK